MTIKKLWISLAVVMIASFAVLLYYGNDLYQKIPPIPDRVVNPAGVTLYTGEDVLDGQNIWQSIGGQTVGSICGHGSYMAPDWTADYLHREALYLLDALAQTNGKTYASLPAEEQVIYQSRLKRMLRTNTYDSTTQTITFSIEQTAAYIALSEYYGKLYKR